MKISLPLGVLRSAYYAREENWRFLLLVSLGSPLSLPPKKEELRHARKNGRLKSSRQATRDVSRLDNKWWINMRYMTGVARRLRRYTRRN